MKQAQLMIPPTMADVRAAILKELDRRGWSQYKLVKALKGKRADGSDVPEGTVYQFLRGRNPINSDDVGTILGVLGLEVGPKKKGK